MTIELIGHLIGQSARDTREPKHWPGVVRFHPTLGSKVVPSTTESIIDRMVREAKSRLAVSIEANANYELFQMKKLWNATNDLILNAQFHSFMDAQLKQIADAMRVPQELLKTDLEANYISAVRTLNYIDPRKEDLIIVGADLRPLQAYKRPMNFTFE